MQASDQVFVSSDGRSWTARITVEGCASESEALAAVVRATRAALGNAADDEADAGRRRKRGHGELSVRENRVGVAERNEDHGTGRVGKRRGLDVGPRLGDVPGEKLLVLVHLGCGLGVLDAVLVHVGGEVF